MSTTHFMLMYDSCSGSTIKNKFAEKGVSDVQVGNFDMLLDLALDFRLISYKENITWECDTADYILKSPNSFWQKSIEVDESAVINEVTKSLSILLNSLSLEKDELPILGREDNSRYTKYYNDLKNLHNYSNNIFPAQITKAKLLRQYCNEKPIKELVIYVNDAIPLDNWQKEVLEIIDSSNTNDTYNIIYKEVFIPKYSNKKEDIKYLQENLFTSNEQAIKPSINNIQFLVTRDSLQSIEVLAGMTQEINISGDNFSDITIVVPNNGYDRDFLIETFDKFNIPLSRVSKKEIYDDLATQWLKNATYAQDELVSPMIFASLLSSSLMPYSNDVGQYLALKAFDNKLNEVDLNNYNDKSKLIINTISKWQNSISFDKDFIKILDEIYNIISSSDSMRVHKQRFKTQLEILTEHIALDTPLNTNVLAKQINNSKIEQNVVSHAYLNSINVIAEDELYLSTTKHLFIVGFNDGHYPKQLPKQGVFSHQQWDKLAKNTKLDLYLQDRVYNLNKNLLLNQIQSATDSITFISNSLDLHGDKQNVSSTLSNIAFTFKDIKEEELDTHKYLILLEKEDKEPFFYSKVKNDKEIKPYHQPNTKDLNLGLDLFSLRKESDGSYKPESPSSLEKLMISPLAWLLYRQGLESKVWDIEKLDPATEGTIAHGVYEDCFNKQFPYGNIEDLDNKIKNRIQTHAPYLEQHHLSMAKEDLTNEIKKSIEIFKELIDTCGIKILQAEEQLTGNFSDIKIAGRTDVILEMDNKKIVVDYKKSGSIKRIKRMENGYDHQLLLYRQMLNDDDAITAYFTLKDSTLIVDKLLKYTSNKNYDIKCIDKDCSINAQCLLEDNIEDLKRGTIKLNIIGDEKLWDDRGVTASYTLNSSLLSIFTKKPEGI